MKNTSLIISGSIIIASVSAILYFAIPALNEYMLYKPVHKITHELDSLLEESILFAQQHGGSLPQPAQFKTYNYFYRLRSWSSPKGITKPGEFGYIQAFLNGPQIGLRPGYCGMFTCLLKNTDNVIHSKCFYQIKQD
jgi:hypothetical protein